MLIACRRVAAVRVRRIRFLVFHLEIDLQIQVVFLNTLMTLDLCKSSFHIIVIIVIRIMLYLVKLWSVAFILKFQVSTAQLLLVWDIFRLLSLLGLGAKTYQLIFALLLMLRFWVASGILDLLQSKIITLVLRASFHLIYPIELVRISMSIYRAICCIIIDNIMLLLAILCLVGI